ncbi:MAG: YitT family protein [Clostridia bacterium]|nr:YitT family protein [Clostridia bacterium]
MKRGVKIFLKILQIIAGAFIYAIGTAFLIDPFNLAPGGVTGIAIILNRAFSPVANVPVGVFVFVLNVPLLIVGLIKFGKEFLVSTVFGTVALSVIIMGLEKLREHLVAAGYTWFIISNPLLGALVGGAFMAVGLGTVFRAGATTGGTDIIVKLLRLKYRYLRTGRVFLFIDSTICVASLPVVGWQVETVLYALVSMLVCSFVLDIVLYGFDGAKLIYIVSDRSERIAARILKELDIGATYLEGFGAYTMEKKEVLMCVVKKHLFPKVKDVVKQEDPRAFLIVASANEIFGEGYKDHFKEEL